MAGPSIARAEVTVDLDGKRIPAEAKALGEEAGAAMGDSHSKAFNERVERGYGDLRKATEEDLRKAGTLAGDSSGAEFSKAFRGVVRGEADSLNREIANIFGSNGLDAFHKTLGQSGDELARIDSTLSLIDDKLLQAAENGSLNNFQLSQLSDEARNWGDEMKKVVLDNREVESSLHSVRENALNGVLDGMVQLRDESERVALENREIEKSLHSVRENALNDVLDGMVKLREESKGLAEAGLNDFLNQLEKSSRESELMQNSIHLARGEVVQLTSNLRNEAIDDFLKKARVEAERLGGELKVMFEDHGGLEGYRRHIQSLRGDFVPVEEVVSAARAKLEEFGHVTTLSSDHLGVFETHIKRFTESAAKGVVNAAGDIVRGVEDIGKESERAAKKADGLGDSLFKALKGTVASAGAGNVVAIITLIAAVAGPAAALLSALAAQTVILGTVAAAAGVGLIGLYLAFSDLFGKSAKTAPAALQPVIAALKDLGKAGQALRTEFQLSVFKDIGPVFDRLADTLPKFGVGVKAVGGALNGFLIALTDGITKNVGPINKLLEGFAPIISSLGSAVVNLAGVFGGLFKAALPFAQEFASSLSKTIKQWSDWINSITGQKALQKWFADAQPIMKSVIGLLDDAGTAFGSLVTPQTKADVQTVLGGIGTALKGLTPVLAALSPVVAVVGKLLGLVGDFVKTLAPVAAGIAAVVAQVEKVVEPIVKTLTVVLEPIFAAIGAALKTIGAIIGALAPVIAGYFDGVKAALLPLTTALSALYEKFVAFVDKAVKIASPAFAEFGTILKLLGTELGALISGFIGAVTQTKAFGDAGKASGGLLDGYKGIIANVTGFLKGLADLIKNQLIPAIKEIDWAKVTKGLDSLGSAIGPIIDALGTLATAFGADITAAAAWAGLLIKSVGDVITAFNGVGKVVSDVLRGDFVAAAIDGAKAFGDVKKASGDLRDGVKDALGKTKDAIDATNTAQKHLATDAKSVSTDVKNAIKDFTDAGDGNLSNLAKRMGLSGSAATDFRASVVDAAKKAGVSLKDVADAPSLSDLEDRLGITGQAARNKFEANIVGSSAASGISLDKLPPKAQAVIGKMLQLGGLHVTPSIVLTGSQLAIQQADAVAKRLRELNASTATVTIVSNQVAQGHTGLALGGVIAGGQAVAGGRAFAVGGVLSSPTWFGSALAGESGMEAIVPLSKPISQVDPSVRNLSAYAQGLNATTDKQKSGSYVAAGAVVINTPASDPAIVAEQVMDRLVPQL